MKRFGHSNNMANKLTINSPNIIVDLMVLLMIIAAYKLLFVSQS